MIHRMRLSLTCIALAILTGLAGVSPAQDAGESENLRLLGKWGHGSCWGVAVDGDRVLAGSGSVLEVCAIDPSQELQVVGQVTLPSPIQGIAVAGDLVYVASRDAGLRIVDISTPAAPVEVGAAWVPDDVWDVAVAGDYAYVAADGAGLRIIDVSNPAAPVETGFVDTDGYATKLKVSGDYVYLADAYGGPSHLATMRIFDVSDPAAPYETGIYQLPDHSYTYAWCLDVVGDLVYVGYEHGYIRVVDVSDPAAPSAVGGFDEGLDNIYDMKIAGGYLYAAYSWRGLGVFDLANPLYPLPVAVLDTPEDARRIDVAGNRTFIADQEGGLQVFDVSDPTTPVLEQALATPGNTHDLCVEGHMVYVADEMFGLRILDLRRRDLPHEVGSIQLAGNPVTVDVMDGYAYVSAASAGLRVVDVRDPTAPVEVGWWDMGGSFESVLAQDGLVYATEWGGLLRIFDVTDPTLPDLVGGFTSTFYVRHMALKDGYLLCAQRNTYNSLWVLNVSNPAAVGSVATHNLDGYSWDIAVLGDTAYLSAGGTGVHILDVTDPTAISFITTYDPSDGANGLVAHDDHLYVAGGGRVWMLDVSNPAVPVWGGWYDVGDVCWEIQILDGELVVADHDDGVLVLRNELRLPSGTGDPVPALFPAVACRPNPCNPATTINFKVPLAGRVRLDVLDARGRRVARLVDSSLAAGPASVVWRGRDDEGRGVSSGVYFVRLRTAGGNAREKVVLLR